MAKNTKTTKALYPADFWWDPVYYVYKNNRKATKFIFKNYEEARRYVRKQLRKLTDERMHGQPALPMWTFGYEIRPV